jgi:hypothetical protein
MYVFRINFELKGVQYSAEVMQTDNLFKVAVDDDVIARYVSEIHLELRPDNNFHWHSPKKMNSLEMDFMIAVAPAIRTYLNK